jgi:hypothetical protein
VCIRSIPETIRSLCLNPEAVSVVQQADPVGQILDLFMSAKSKDVSMLDLGTIDFLGQSLDELFRHCRPLLEPGMKSALTRLTQLSSAEVRFAARRAWETEGELTLIHSLRPASARFTPPSCGTGRDCWRPC